MPGFLILHGVNPPSFYVITSPLPLPVGNSYYCTFEHLNTISFDLPKFYCNLLTVWPSIVTFSGSSSIMTEILGKFWILSTSLRHALALKRPKRLRTRLCDGISSFDLPFSRTHRVSKNVPSMACYNFHTHEQILIFLAENYCCR